MTAALTGLVYTTEMYRVITDDDIKDYKLRFVDKFPVSTANAQPIIDLYNLRYFFIKAIITRNIDNNFTYELPNIQANTITRNTANNGFTVTIRTTLALPLYDNKDVKMTLNIVQNEGITIYSIPEKTTQSFGN